MEVKMAGSSFDSFIIAVNELGSNQFNSITISNQ